MNTLIYVDRELLVGIGAMLVGVSQQETTRKGYGASLNWLIQSNVSIDDSLGVTRDIRELLPELLFYRVYPKISKKFDQVETAVKALATPETSELLPGTPVAISGVLSFPEITGVGSYNPFDPPNIPVKTFLIHGERCFVGRLHQSGFVLPAYFVEQAKSQVIFCQDQPVEVIGVLRWSPPYSPGGAKSLNLLLRVVALLLR